MNGKVTVLLAGGIFVATFGVSLAALFIHGGAATAPSAARAEVVAAGKPDPVPWLARVDTKMVDLKAHPMTAAELKAFNDRQDNDMTEVLARIKGGRYSPELVGQAKDDAPSNPLYFKVATLDGKPTKTFCISHREGGESQHAGLRYNAETIEPAQMPIPVWVTSGCASAIQKSGTVMSRPAFLQATLNITPASPLYAADRANLTKMLNTLPPGG